MTVHQPLSEALDELQSTLKMSHLWQVETPTDKAFSSQQPFCVDTMSMPQWLRFVFIGRLQALVDARGAMPAKCEVAPAVAVYLQQENISASDQRRIIKAVERIDDLVTRY
ncbi:YqcC family protein [Vreelandella aquamarina]